MTKKVWIKREKKKKAWDEWEFFKLSQENGNTIDCYYCCYDYYYSIIRRLLFIYGFNHYNCKLFMNTFKQTNKKRKENNENNRNVNK